LVCLVVRSFGRLAFFIVISRVARTAKSTQYDGLDDMSCALCFVFVASFGFVRLLRCRCVVVVVLLLVVRSVSST